MRFQPASGTHCFPYIQHLQIYQLTSTLVMALTHDSLQASIIPHAEKVQCGGHVSKKNSALVDRLRRSEKLQLMNECIQRNFNDRAGWQKRH
jgi:hypothetical protein